MLLPTALVETGILRPGLYLTQTDRLVSQIMQAEIDGGARPGVTAEDKARIQELERENKELRRAKEILKSASAFFARELDPRPPRL
jgi:transposase